MKLKFNKIKQFLDEIVKAKVNNVTIETSTEEQEIGCLVYKLYGQTYDKVKRVDP